MGLTKEQPVFLSYNYLGKNIVYKVYRTFTKKFFFFQLKNFLYFLKNIFFLIYFINQGLVLKKSVKGLAYDYHSTFHYGFNSLS